MALPILIKNKEAIMNHLLVKCFVCIIMIFVVGSAYAVNCDKPGSSEDSAYCIGKELHESDVRINYTYQALMSKLAKSEQDKLRHEQRSWIKERDAVCNCASRESDREKWYQGLLKDYRKTVCVTRYTRQRTAELDRMLTDISYEPQNKKTAEAPWQPRTNTVKYVETDYQIWSKGDKTTGRWYFEVTVDTGSIAGFSPTALWMGCADRKSGEAFGSLSQIRGSYTGAAVSRMGYALDLESGKLYIRRNGAWSRGTPGSLGGLDLKLGRPYRCGVETTVLIAGLADKGYLEVNFGEKPFAHSIPDGYRPYTEGRE
jgi:uncharacterized protein YecT (DUF1311 family)